MKDWIPKVGDLVTPDPDMCDDGTFLKEVIGSVYKVVAIDKGSMSLSSPIYGLYHGWVIKYWMPAKNATVLQIIKDL